MNGQLLERSLAANENLISSSLHATLLYIFFMGTCNSHAGVGYLIYIDHLQEDILFFIWPLFLHTVKSYIRCLFVCLGTDAPYLVGSRKFTHSRVIIGTITALYILNLCQMVLQWYYTSAIFVENKYTKMSMFLLTIEGSAQPKFGIAILAFQCTGFILADGLMVST